MFDYTKVRGQKNNLLMPLIPHPDGKAWPKCCKAAEYSYDISCAFVRTQDCGERISAHSGSASLVYGGEGTPSKVSEVPFMCCHRSTDDGYYRVCAGWDACFGNKAAAAKSR